MNENTISSAFVEIMEDLLDCNDAYHTKIKVKCPEVAIKLNEVSVIALIDTGSEISALSEEWFNQHKEELKPYEMLRMHNTVVKGAIGSKSKNITRQILIKTEIGGRIDDCVFVIVPGLIRDCIVGIELLEEGGGVLDLADKKLSFA